MRPTTPNFNFAQQAGPSSPPATPTATTFTFGGKKSRRQGIANFHDFPSIQPTVHTNGGTITPNGSGTTFSYNRFEPLDLSPRSSSPASSHHSSESEADSAPARSRSSSPVEPISESPPKHTRVRIVTKANFEVEEFRDSDYEHFDSDCESVLRPHQYEDAESEKARSTRASSPHHELDEGVVNGLRDLYCGTEELDAEEERELWAKKQKEIKRMKRRSSGSVKKRNLAESIGSDTDDEDVQPLCEGANEAGSSARRLKRKVGGDRTSLIFDDPPVGRIEEVEEPLSGEEGAVIVEVEEGIDDEEESWERAMPFYGQEDMDIDSEDEDDSEDSDEE